MAVDANGMFPAWLRIKYFVEAYACGYPIGGGWAMLTPEKKGERMTLLRTR